MTEKSLTQRIIEKYQGEDGNWVVARGKVTEVKFLKEAVAEIGFYKRRVIEANNELREFRREYNKTYEAKVELDRDRKQFYKMLESSSSDIGFMLRSIEKMKEKYKDAV